MLEWCSVNNKSFLIHAQFNSKVNDWNVKHDTFNYLYIFLKNNSFKRTTWKNQSENHILIFIVD